MGAVLATTAWGPIGPALYMAAEATTDEDARPSLYPVGMPFATSQPFLSTIRENKDIHSIPHYTGTYSVDNNVNKSEIDTAKRICEHGALPHADVKSDCKLEKDKGICVAPMHKDRSGNYISQEAYGPFGSTTAGTIDFAGMEFDIHTPIGSRNHQCDAGDCYDKKTGRRIAQPYSRQEGKIFNKYTCECKPSAQGAKMFKHGTNEPKDNCENGDERSGNEWRPKFRDADSCQRNYCYCY